MENADNFLLLLKDDIDYRKIQQGKDVYSNFIKRQEGIRKVFVENYLQHIEDSFLCDFGGKKFAVSKVESIFETLTMCCKLFLSGDISKAMSKLYDCYFEEGNTKLKKRTIEKNLLTNTKIFLKIMKVIHQHYQKLLTKCMSLVN